MPAAAPRPEPEAVAPPAEASSEAEAEDTPEGEDWRPTYEKNLAEWRAEADVARERAETTRAKFEAEAAAKLKAEADAKKSGASDADAEAKRKERLAAALAEPPSPASVPWHKRAAVEQRAAKMKEAWEHVKPKDEHGLDEDKERKGTTPSAPSSQWEELSAPHSSVEDISSAARSGATSSPASEKKDQEKQSETKDVTVPAGITPSSINSSAAAPPPADATPSLTLSLFTAPDSLTLPRVLAALGINLILPFINGVFLGFGEITAREAVRVGRLWWKGERAIAGFWRRDDGSVSSGARAVSGVGLSGGGGF